VVGIFKKTIVLFLSCRNSDPELRPEKNRKPRNPRRKTHNMNPEQLRLLNKHCIPVTGNTPCESCDYGTVQWRCPDRTGDYRPNCNRCAYTAAQIEEELENDCGPFYNEEVAKKC